MTTAVDFAAELERFAAEVIELRGVSRRNPHAFAEDKSDLSSRMRRRAVELRTPPRAAPRPQMTIEPGTRIIGSGRRLVDVVVRRDRRIGG